MTKLEKLSEGSWHYRMMGDIFPDLLRPSDALIDLYEGGTPVVALTPDLIYSGGLAKFYEKHPDRVINTGLSEQNTVSMAAGLATTGATPWVSGMSAFLALLCNEQIRMDVAYSQQNVRFLGHHTGLAFGFYGSSHHATEDIGALRSIANMTIISPSDDNQQYAAMMASKDYDGPIYYRTGRGRNPEVYEEGSFTFEIGKAHEHMKGDEVTIIACGMPVHPSLQVAKKLNAEGHSVGLLDMATIKPLDVDAVLEAASRSKVILTIEEHNVLGGLGSAVAEVMAENPGNARLIRHGIKDEYSLIGPPTHLYGHYKLDEAGIESVVRDAMK
ncbi:transketolase family protein [Paracoccus tegillarcae]|uniref:Transketolase n=1 Tax=Paracoccus tegillarcae TaxID=1529068 RepID=A0A2K9F1G8_9RHOB|nr:transketolase C-terminal domain-containing protein [Paracoccus tegillarcae]AUH34212.1 transketolase [Paracoccus tegillarcae]